MGVALFFVAFILLALVYRAIFKSVGRNVSREWKEIKNTKLEEQQARDKENIDRFFDELERRYKV